MTGSFRSWSLLAILAALGSAVVPLSQAQAAAPEKKRVSVAPFDYSAVRPNVQKTFGKDQDIGKGIQAMLVKRINSDRTGVRLGEIRGADALLYGYVVTFGRDDRTTGDVGAGEEGRATVGIYYRLVNADTSEVIASGEAVGESSQKNKRSGKFMTGKLMTVLKRDPAGPPDMNSPDFAKTSVGEATMNCVNKLAAILNEQVPKVQKTIDVKARVAYVDGASLTINAGSEAGVVSGDRFEVNHLISEIRDPQSHKIIDFAMEKIGEMVITTVKAKVAVGTFTGAGHPQISDEAKKM